MSRYPARVLRLFLPLALLAGAAWHFGFYQSQRTAQQRETAPLRQLESDVASLAAETSEPRLKELNAAAAKASGLLLESKDNLPGTLRELKQLAHQKGWEASFIPAEDEIGPVSNVGIQFLPVRAKLKVRAENTAAYPSLLALLEEFSSFPKRIDLTRLTIRADDNRWQSVELTLRLAASSASNAKTP